MAFIQLGTLDQLQISIPTKLTTNWADQLREDFFQKVVEHDHSGNGKGSQLGSAAFADDSLNQVKIRLQNDAFLRSRNAADSGDVNIIKVDTEDEIVIGARVKDIDTDLVVSENITASNSDIMNLTTRKVIASGSVTIESSGTSVIASFDGTKNQRLEYRITYNGSIQSGTLECHNAGALNTEEYIGTDLGFEFLTLGGTDIELDTNSEPTISAGNPVIVTFILKEI